jgi:hypothetical protein
VGDAAVEQQLQMRRSHVGFANLISSAALRENATWPFFRIPDFEVHGGQMRLQSGSEAIGCINLVQPEEEDAYLQYVTENYEDSLKEGHMTAHGNLDRLITMGYAPNFTIVTPEGLEIDTTIRPYRSPFWQISPRTFHKTVYHDLSLMIQLT